MPHLARSVVSLRRRRRRHAGLVGGAVYGTSKRPLSLLIRSRVAEYGPRGVNVNELAPGRVRTPGTDAMGEGLDEIIGTVPVTLDPRRMKSPREEDIKTYVAVQKETITHEPACSWSPRQWCRARPTSKVEAVALVPSGRRPVRTH